jgi:sterol desaturase/sphingolipid hydroxylase (fatty acid hydroxylase superfamily)
MLADKKANRKFYDNINSMTAYIVKLLLQALAAFLFGTVVFDFVHYSFHACLKSKYKILRAIGGFHLAHHRFYTPQLQIDKSWTTKNLLRHAVVEYTIQMLAMSSCLLFLPHLAVFIAMGFQTMIFSVVVFQRGADPNHKPYTLLPSSRGGFFVSPEYHALHHAQMNHCYSSYIKLIDYIFGSSQHLRGKRIAMTGASGALGSNMKKLLEKEGAEVTTFKYGVDYDYDNYDKLKEPLAQTDILLLCHGTKYENTQEANCDSYISIIELFKSVRKRDLVPVEVWGVGSEIEFHPSFGIKSLLPYSQSKRNYARRARTYFRDRDIQYRHIVHAAFWSQMGPGLMTASFAAKATLFLIKRDFKYVPVTYTGFAFFNYFKFVFGKAG